VTKKLDPSRDLFFLQKLTAVPNCSLNILKIEGGRSKVEEVLFSEQSVKIISSAIDEILFTDLVYINEHAVYVFNQEKDAKFSLVLKAEVPSIENFCDE
jgi:hypothetical protein